MSREVRRVPANWEHPKDENGHYIPMHEYFPYSEEETEKGLRNGWLDNDPPNYGCEVMPQWPESERTHYQMYESITEGTPISPVMESPTALARWLADNKASAGPNATATYDQWLAMIKEGSSAGSFAMNRASGEITSGVEAVSGLPNVFGLPKQIDDNTYCIDILAGANITDAIAEAISAARRLDTTMQFEFNGVTVSVRSDSHPELIRRDWSRAFSGYIDGHVGPYPNPVLTDQEKENDARIEAENSRKRQERQNAARGGGSPCDA